MQVSSPPPPASGRHSFLEVELGTTLGSWVWGYIWLRILAVDQNVSSLHIRKVWRILLLFLKHRSANDQFLPNHKYLEIRTALNQNNLYMLTRAIRRRVITVTEPNVIQKELRVLYIAK